MFVNKRTLLVYVALDASCIGAGGEPRLFQFKPAVRIVTIAAFHGAFQHLVMEGQLKLVLRLTVTTQTQLGFAHLE